MQFSGVSGLLSSIKLMLQIFLPCYECNVLYLVENQT